jgi:hypothetical protein
VHKNINQGNKARKQNKEIKEENKHACEKEGKAT